ncbi:MAG TPA: hypothetical protein VNM45_04900 [Bacillus sp. (in: firmicutes)]|nr:hypothetical protein [Bacillus sp. (in: firmicutes)]
MAGIQNETSKTVTSMEHVSNEVEEGIGIVHLAGDSFSQIKQSVSQLDTQIEQISVAVDKISSATEHVINSVIDISKIAEVAAAGTQSVSAETQEQLAAMEEISASSIALTTMAEELQTAIGKFKV